MARRRVVATVEEVVDEGVPLVLARCVAEDWTSPEEVAEMVDPREGSWLSAPSWVAMMLTHGRWSEAKRQWWADNDIPRERQCELVPSRMPSFEDRERFLAAVDDHMGGT